MPEFALIERLAQITASAGGGVELGIGDDAAVLVPNRGEVLVAATDTLNEGVHFESGADPASLGHKLLAINLSDLAAMGAEPRWALMNLSLPDAVTDWIDAFGAGFAALAQPHGVRLVGGDTCSGPCSLSLTLLGAHSPGRAIRRDGARAGDRIVVSGTLGNAGLAWRQRSAGNTVLPESLARALDRPVPRVALGIALRGLASACIDVSDGLAADLGHLSRASGLAAEVSLSRLPRSSHLDELPEQERWNLQVAGGEDYELCFTVPEGQFASAMALGEALDVSLTAIGVMRAGAGVSFRTPDADSWRPTLAPWEHFSASAGLS